MTERYEYPFKSNYLTINNRKIHFLDENAPSYHEWDTAIRLAKYCRFIHIQEPLFIYYIHNNTISNNSNKSVNYI